MTNEEAFSGLYAPYFTYREFRCDCPRCADSGDGWFRTPEFISFMSHLSAMRQELGFPFIINSGYRCPTYNAEISSTGLDGPHTKGAADVKVAFERAYKLNNMAGDLGMGIGVNQTGDVAGRYIHVDNQGARIWTY